MEAEAEERAVGMRLALDTARGLHDKVRLALGGLRLQGTRLPRRLEQDVQALDALRDQLQQLEELLEECWGLPPVQNQQQAELLCCVDQTRGDLIASCRQCTKFVVSCQDLVAEVLEFCEIRQEEDVTPREFTTCWRAAADAAADADRLTAQGPASTCGTILTNASPLPGLLATEVTSAPPAAGATAAAAAAATAAAVAVADTYTGRASPARPKPGSDGHGQASEPRHAEPRGDTLFSEGQREPDVQGALAAAAGQSPLAPAAPGRRAAMGDAAVAAAGVSGRREHEHPAGAGDGPTADAVGAQRSRHGHHHKHHHHQHHDQREEGLFAFESPLRGRERAAAVGPPWQGAAQMRQQQPPQQYVRYGTRGVDRRLNASAAPSGSYHSAGAAAVVEDDAPRPGTGAQADSSQYGGTVSLQRYARGQGDGSDDSGGAVQAKAARRAEAPRPQRRRDTDAQADARSSRELWLAASQMASPPRMRVLQDAVMMSREDLEKLNAKSRRRGWLVGAAKIVGGLATLAALGAAAVVMVQMALDEYSGPGGRCDTDDAQLEPLVPRLPGLPRLDRGNSGEAKGRQGRDRKGREGGGKARGGEQRGGRGLVLQMPQMPYVPVFPAPSSLDSRA